MEEFPINVTIGNIYFSDHDAVRNVIDKDAVDFHTVPTVPSSFSFMDAANSQDCRGKDDTIFLPLPRAHEH